MKPPPFSYHDPRTVADVVALLGRLDHGLQLGIQQKPAAGTIPDAGAAATAPQHRHVIAAFGVPCQQGLECRQHAVGAHRAVVVGDVVENVGVLAALDLGDRPPFQHAGAE